MSVVIFDIGANDGSSSIQNAIDFKTQIVAFEPVPEVIKVLKHRTSHLRNYAVVEKAVSDFTGTAKLHVSGVEKWHSSSLKTFNENLKETWPEKKDAVVTKEIDVEVTTLKDFIEEHKVEKIDYIHSEAQGCNLEILLGLGDKISLVTQGDMKMPVRHSSKLYKDEKYIAGDAVNYLLDHGFRISKIEHSDPSKNEVTIFYFR